MSHSGLPGSIPSVSHVNKMCSFPLDSSSDWFIFGAPIGESARDVEQYQGGETDLIISV